jgi:B-box zinc finger/Putative zinc finger in N-recognin (UBR box)
MNVNLRPEREPCREHPEEEVNYFCFDCQTTSGPICSECVIHGLHKGHNVSTLKKAYPQILAKIEELQIQLGTKVDELQLQNQRLESRKREMAD